jgi:hypothetical protein
MDFLPVLKREAFASVSVMDATYLRTVSRSCSESIIPISSTNYKRSRVMRIDG